MKKLFVCVVLMWSVSPMRADEVKVVDVPSLAEPKRVDGKKIYEYITLRNVTPRMVAWWLDPQHNPVPAQFRAAHIASGASLQRSKELGDSPPRLPAGIESLVAIDPQNALLAIGTNEGIAELKRLVAVLDRPIRQVEIETQIVRLSPQGLKSLGLDFEDQKEGESTAVRRRFNSRDQLKKLEANGQAKTISSPRVTAISNLTATIQSFTETPMTIPASEDDFFGSSDIFVYTRVGIEVTPTILDGDTVSLACKPLLGRSVATKPIQSPNIDESSWLPINDYAAPTFSTVRDGDTIAVLGMRLPRESKTKAGDKTAGGAVVFFVTPRIVRRVDDPVPGLQ